MQNTTPFSAPVVPSLLLLIFVLSGVAAGVFPAAAAFPPDDYEPDNSHDQAQVIVVNYDTPQHHTFHVEDDEDWVQFYALEDVTYFVEVLGPQVLICDPVIELYSPDNLITPLVIVDQNGPGVDETLEICTSGDQQHCSEGLYYVKVSNKLGIAGSNVWYDLQVRIPDAFSLPGYVTGMVTSGGQAVAGAVFSSGIGSGLSQGNGSYILSLESGTHVVSVAKDGYHGATFSVTVPEGSSVTKNVELVPLVNNPPTISGIKDTTVVYGREFRLTPAAGDPDGHSISFSVTGKPAWMNFNTAKGELSGTPGEEHRGLHGPITITVSDYFGASSSLAPFTVKVVSAAELENFKHLPATYHLLFSN